jgi:hypothetical protein
MTARNRIIGLFAMFLAAAIVVNFRQKGPPFFTRPVTPLDHVHTSRGEHETAPLLRLCQRVAPLLPHGATVAVFQPSQSPNFDTRHYATALGMLERQQVVTGRAMKAGEVKPDYVVTLVEPLNDPAYTVIAEFPEGKLQKRTQ